MKLVIECVERIAKRLVVDTDDYVTSEDKDDKTLEIAELINEAKAEPMKFFLDDIHSVEELRERTSVTVSKHK